MTTCFSSQSRISEPAYRRRTRTSFLRGLSVSTPASTPSTRAMVSAWPLPRLCSMSSRAKLTSRVSRARALLSPSQSRDSRSSTQTRSAAMMGECFLTRTLTTTWTCFNLPDEWSIHSISYTPRHSSPVRTHMWSRLFSAHVWRSVSGTRRCTMEASTTICCPIGPEMTWLRPNMATLPLRNLSRR